jgi:hypothetical protein
MLPSSISFWTSSSPNAVQLLAANGFRVLLSQTLDDSLASAVQELRRPVVLISELEKGSLAVPYVLANSSTLDAFVSVNMCCMGDVQRWQSLHLPMLIIHDDVANPLPNLSNSTFHFHSHNSSETIAALITYLNLRFPK